MPRQKSEKTILKEECERLMYELAFKIYGQKCEICGSDFGLIVHHFIPRSKCKILTYHPDNWIVLCRNCHFDLHQRQNSLIVSKIIEKRGKKWLKKLEKEYEKVRKITSYYGINWLKEQLRKLQKLLKENDEKGTKKWRINTLIHFQKKK
jgi:5-methylcytosine-specific restriction endonuclease McrA